MESKDLSKQRNERLQMAHKLETPQPLVLAMREQAEIVLNSKPDKRVENLVDFKQVIIHFMNHFNLDMKDFVSDMEDKRFSQGGFTRRAVQKHPYLGVEGLRLVRDNRSTDFLLEGAQELYLTLLDKKLEEETKELVEAMSRSERKEELGDVFEVFNTILLARGISASVVESRRQVKEVGLRKEKREARKKLSKK